MVTRKALIIGAPDQNIPGVHIDCRNLINYLKSPTGGYWSEKEVTGLISPSLAEVQGKIDLLKDVDYAFVFFAGHGYYSNEKETTVLKVNTREVLLSDTLRLGSTKQTVILDCCRERESEPKLRETIVNKARVAKTLDSGRCRALFDEMISDASNGLVVMNGCAIGQTAGESAENGGYYTSSLLMAAQSWAASQISDAGYTTQECHEHAAVTVVRVSGERQTPSYESPRGSYKFPFGVVA